MSKPNKQKIDTNPVQQGLNAGWGSALEGLNLGALPAGPEPTSEKAAPVKRGRVLLRRETAHRGGKAVTIAYDFEPQITDELIADLATRLRKACGTGGTLRGREIEIQGENVEKIRALLAAEGFRVAGIGGKS